MRRLRSVFTFVILLGHGWPLQASGKPRCTPGCAPDANLAASVDLISSSHSHSNRRISDKGAISSLKVLAVFLLILSPADAFIPSGTFRSSNARVGFLMRKVVADLQPIVVRRGGPLMMPTADEARRERERQERLKQLFGDEAGSKIADTTKSTKKEGSFEVGVQMLQEGVQQLEWGAIRLIDVRMAEGPLEASFQPLLADSSLLCVRLDEPFELGVGLRTSGLAKGNYFVTALEESELRRASGIQVGDIIRATTSVQMGMSYPLWQLIAGGVGQPKRQKVLLPIQGQLPDDVITAINSNLRANDANGQVVLVLERAGAASSGSSE